MSKLSEYTALIEKELMHSNRQPGVVRFENPDDFIFRVIDLARARMAAKGRKLIFALSEDIYYTVDVGNKRIPFHHPASISVFLA